MKKLFIALSLFVLSFSFSSAGFAYMREDINNDNKIGTAEAIYALQVTAGLRSPIINVPENFSTIQKAIDAAYDGYTINISAGTYTESLVIKNKGVSLQGAGKDVTIINGNGADVVTIESARGVILSGLTLQQGNYGIYAIRGASIEVSDVVVQDVTGIGINITGPSLARLTNITVQRSGDHGIQAFGSSGLFFYGTIVSSNNKNDGIGIFNSSNATFNPGAIITSNSNGRNGINIAVNAGLVAFNASITTQNNVSEGIQSYGSSAINLQANSSILSENNSKEGLYVGSVSSFYSDSSSILTIRNSKRYGGILVAESSNADISGTTLVENNANYGVFVNLSSSIYFNGTVNLLNNTGMGLSVMKNSSVLASTTSRLTVSGTTGGSGMGLFIYENSTLGISGSLLVENNTGTFGWGIGIQGNAHVTLQPASPNTVIIQTNGTGIFLSFNCSGRFFPGTSILNNTKQGIRAEDTSQIIADGISVQNNGTTGIEADDGSGLRMSGSTVNENTGKDINLTLGSRATLSNNTIGTISCDATSVGRGITCPQ